MAGASPAGVERVSIHAPRAGRDRRILTALQALSEFQSTRPARGATDVPSGDYLLGYVFQSTRPARGATRIWNSTWTAVRVSIHAPRAGRDDADPRGTARRPCCFNPRAPRGARHRATSTEVISVEFQSTRPARGATTVCRPDPRLLSMFQSTRPARGATSAMATMPSDGIVVSIHAPRAGRDSASPLPIDVVTEFQSTRPARGATEVRRCSRGCVLQVSIHAPRAGRDRRSACCRAGAMMFQSTRPARGATAPNATSLLRHVTFQSTRPARGATLCPRHTFIVLTFQSTRPARGATGGGVGNGMTTRVSIHAPRAGRDTD